jgi:kumamolisin
MPELEVLGAVAPGVRIAVYFAPNTAQGFVEALITAIHDTEHRPSVISWGAAEIRWTGQAMAAFDELCLDAAQLGITVCASSGDGGSANGVHDGVPHVNFPASCPRVLGCGGTRMHVQGGARHSEVVWNDGSGASGGGVSHVFPVPEWQSGEGIPGDGRGVPDVAGHADPTAGYLLLRIHDRDVVAAGTSAVAPLWAGLLARLNEHLPAPAGFVTALLYGSPARGTFHSVTDGTNDTSGLGVYEAGSGWDPCTGLGTLGVSLLAALGGSEARA